MLLSALKVLIFSVVVILAHCYYGFTAKGGPAGVGIAVGRSVRNAIVIISLTDFFLSLAHLGNATTTVRVAGMTGLELRAAAAPPDPPAPARAPAPLALPPRSPPRAAVPPEIVLPAGTRAAGVAGRRGLRQRRSATTRTVTVRTGSVGN